VQLLPQQVPAWRSTRVGCGSLRLVGSRAPRGSGQCPPDQSVRRAIEQATTGAGLQSTHAWHAAFSVDCHGCRVAVRGRRGVAIRRISHGVGLWPSARLRQACGDRCHVRPWTLAACSCHGRAELPVPLQRRIERSAVDRARRHADRRLRLYGRDPRRIGELGSERLRRHLSARPRCPDLNARNEHRARAARLRGHHHDCRPARGTDRHPASWRSARASS